jgi:hypothetical protein
MKKSGERTRSARNAAYGSAWSPKPASRKKSTTLVATTTITSVATDPSAWTTSARASVNERRSASPGPRPSTSTAGTASAVSPYQARASR